MLTKEQRDSIIHACEVTIQIPHQFRNLLHIQFKEYCGMYTFTTENIRSYLSKLKIKNKEVLTVTASGDHLINLALAGASKVHNFDINKNAYYMTQLKLAALQTLDYEDFLQFFIDCEKKEITHVSLIAAKRRIGENRYIFDYKTYQQIRENLAEDCALYWDILYQQYHFDGFSLANSGILLGCDRESTIYNNQYLQNEEEYLKAREAVKKIDMQFFSMNLLELYKLPYTYDLILLSNIYDYVTDEYLGGISEYDFNKYIEEELSKKLKGYGIISMEYQYNYKTKKSTPMSFF